MYVQTIKCEIHVMKNVIFIPDENDFVKETGKNFKHSGDLGDVIYSLPVIKHFGYGNLFLVLNGLETKKYDGSASGLDRIKFEAIMPLLEAQNYIKQIKVWNKEINNINIDFDLCRYKFSKKTNLCHKILDIFNVDVTELNTPWLTCNPKKVAKVVINRTFRYRNKNMDYTAIKEYFKDAVFIGQPDEYMDFVNRFGRLDYYPTKNLLEAAEIIAGSEFFIGNQSVCMAISIGLGHTNFQEYYPQCADCIFDFDHCNFFYAKN